MSFEKHPPRTLAYISRREACVGIVGGGTLAAGTAWWRERNSDDSESAMCAPEEKSETIYPRKDKWIVGQQHPQSENIWKHYEDVPLFYEDTLVHFGADLNRAGSPIFHTDKATTKILKAQPNAQCVSGIVESDGEKRVTKQALNKAKERSLQWIRETPRPILYIVSAHGVPNEQGVIDEISLGKFDDPVRCQLSVRMPTAELVHSLEERYSSMPERLEDQNTPDKIAIITCGGGNIAQDIVYLLGQTKRAQGAFKPTTPFIFSAGTGGEITFANQMLIEMAQCKTVGELKARMHFVGTDKQHSNPMFFVPEPTTGESVIIG
jgi:hypothetical protein